MKVTIISLISALSPPAPCQPSREVSGTRPSLEATEDRGILSRSPSSAARPTTVRIHLSVILLLPTAAFEGTVENSILFRGVKVGRNAKINNSIIMQDGICGENVTLNCVISDKNVVIRDGITLSGVSSQPYYISKGRML